MGTGKHRTAEARLRARLLRNGWRVAPDPTRISNADAAAFFDAKAGAVRGSYDPETDLWLVPDTAYDGPGHAFWVYSRDGSSRHVVVGAPS